MVTYIDIAQVYKWNFTTIRDNEIYSRGNEQVRVELSPVGRKGASMRREMGCVHHQKTEEETRISRGLRGERSQPVSQGNE